MLNYRASYAKKLFWGTNYIKLIAFLNLNNCMKINYLKNIIFILESDPMI
jgi:hypothetical protein